MSRACALNTYDWPRLATVTPNGKFRAAAQNHAKFVSFCKDIRLDASRVPSLEDLAQRRTERAIQVLLDIEDFVSANAGKGAGAVSPSAQVKKGSGFYTPTKKMHKKGHLPSVALAVNSSPMVKILPSL